MTLQHNIVNNLYGLRTPDLRSLIGQRDCTPVQNGVVMIIVIIQVKSNKAAHSRKAHEENLYIGDVMVIRSVVYRRNDQGGDRAALT